MHPFMIEMPNLNYFDLEKFIQFRLLSLLQQLYP